MNKTEIHEFDPVIYPFKLWITITNDVNTIKERFTIFDEDEEIDGDFIRKNDAVTMHVDNKDTGKRGVLIIFRKRKYCTIRTIAHESAHASDFFWRHIQERSPGEEPNAYLVGWVADCVYKVKTGKYG